MLNDARIGSRLDITALPTATTPGKVTMFPARLRSVRLAAPTVVLAVVLAACGGDTSESVDEPAPTTSPDDSEPAADEPPAPTTAPDEPEPGTTGTRTVEDAFGPVELPAAAERPVPLDGVYAAYMVSLGVQPAAVPNDVKLQFSALEEWLPEGAEIESLSEFGESYPLNLEALAALGPDLVIAGDWELDYYGDTLPQIAPIYSTLWGHNGDWRARFLRVADALDRTDEAQAVSDEFDAFVAELPPEVMEQTVAFVRASGLDNIRADILETSFPGSVARAAGIPVLDLTGEVEVDADASWIDLSPETLGLLSDADVIIISDLSFYDPENPSTDAVLAGSPLWEALPAVQAGNVVMVPGPVYNGGFYEAATALLDAVARAVTGDA